VVPLPDANRPPPGEFRDRENQAAIGNDRGLPALTSGEFPPGLLAIWQDPEVRKLAARRAGDPDLAQDALLAAVAAVARVGDLARIEDLKAYFCRVLINEVYRLRGQLAAARPFDPATLAAMSDAGTSAPPSEHEAVTRLLARAWLDQFRTQRVHLRAAVPGRSSQPARYRDLVAQTAEHILRTVLDGSVSWADCNEALQAALPDWFGRPGSAENTCHKHLSRARRDIQDLLKAVISRDELLP
jgi:DNA-directed RNA polymerase specialized sigma24 family protein